MVGAGFVECLVCKCCWSVVWWSLGGVPGWWCMLKRGAASVNAVMCQSWKSLRKPSVKEGAGEKIVSGGLGML